MPDLHRLRAVTGTLAVVTALASSLLVPLAGTATAATSATTPATTDSADAAAGWLARQLVDGDHLTTTAAGTVYLNVGGTADAVLGLAATGVAQRAAAKATAWLATPANLSSWIGDGTTAVYAGSTAKAALVALVQGLDPTDFGGIDLITRLRGQEQTTGSEAGRFLDTSPWGEFSNTFGQSLAVIALQRADATGADTAAVDYLAGQQCTDGGFRLNLAAPGGACASDPDATALAVQALLLSGRDAAADKGLDYLAGIQQADGGIGGVGPTAGENANTTGLVAQAFAAGNRTDARARAVAYLTQLQQGCTTPADQRGAIAYDASPFTAATATGATAQALLGLAGVGMGTLSASGASTDEPVLDCPAAPATTAPASAAPASTAPARVESTTARSATLPDTGSANGPLAALGIGLVLAGVVLVAVSRRRGEHA